MQTILNGHSGCKVILCEPHEGSAFVRKISSSKNYNNRLQIQATKQKEFFNDVILTPKFLNDGYTEQGLYYFDMEYVQGITLSEYIKVLEVNKIRGLVEDLVANFVKNEEHKSDSVPFFNKINLLKSEVSSLDNELVNNAINLLANHDWSNIKKSFCHGDMTLENIIVKDGQLYLIDFLDSFYDSWLFDVSTLLQDVQTMWSYRLENKVSVNTSIRLIIFRDILIDEIKKICGNKYIEIYYVLLLKLIRIYPYTSDNFTYNFLNKKVSEVIDLIKQLEC